MRLVYLLAHKKMGTGEPKEVKKAGQFFGPIPSFPDPLLFNKLSSNLPIYLLPNHMSETYGWEWAMSINLAAALIDT